MPIRRTKPREFNLCKALTLVGLIALTQLLGGWRAPEGDLAQSRMQAPQTIPAIYPDADARTDGSEKAGSLI